MTFCDDLIGTLGAVAVGSVLAGAGGPLPLAAGAAGTGAAVPARRGARRLGGDRSRRGRPPAVARDDRCPGFVASPAGQSTRPWPTNLLVARHDCGGARRTAAAGDHRGAVRPRAGGGQERRPRAVGDPRRHPRRHRRRGHGHLRVESQHPGQPPGASTAGTGPTTWTVVVGSATSPDRPRPSFSTQTPSSRVGVGVSILHPAN